LALYNRDHNGPDLAFQLLIYPMIDDRHDTPSGQEITYEKVWNRDVSLKAWQMYLGDEYGSDAVSPYAAAVRAQDLSGLPPAFITVGTRDLFREALIQDGISRDLEDELRRLVVVLNEMLNNRVVP